jgi:flagellar FliL protein
MSAPETAAPAAADAPAPKAASPLMLVIALVGGLAVGGVAGAFVAGPLVAHTLSAPPAAAPAHAEAEASGDEESEEGEEGEEGAATPKPVHLIDNLVLNPAESGGQRFLLLSIAFELKDAAALEALKARDAELRDAVLQSMGARTVEYLSDMTMRDSLKTELRDVAGKLFPETKAPVVRRIYFPQFVIQ